MKCSIYETIGIDEVLGWWCVVDNGAQQWKWFWQWNVSQMHLCAKSMQKFANLQLACLKMIVTSLQSLVIHQPISLKALCKMQDAKVLGFIRFVVSSITTCCTKHVVPWIPTCNQWFLFCGHLCCLFCAFKLGKIWFHCKI